MTVCLIVAFYAGYREGEQQNLYKNLNEHIFLYIKKSYTN